jgi:hypothetical protein
MLLLAPWIEEAMSAALDLGQWRMLGLAFLLGSFAVATLSDLKRLSAQREFLEIWVLFTLGVLAWDLVQTGRRDWEGWQVPALKWALIFVLGLLSWHKVGPIFRLARADVFACAAAASLLNPILVVGFWIVLKVFALVLGPILARGRPYWPFMPVVTCATVVAIGAGFLFAAA